MAACIPTKSLANLISQVQGHAWPENGGIALGAIAFQAQYHVDFASESLVPVGSGSGSPAPTAAPTIIYSPRARLLKHGGRYLFDIRGKLVECSSLKDMLKKGLLAIEEHSPGMLTELAKLKPRTRRIVAQKASDLFADPKLTRFGEPLKPGWFYGTNNSAATTKDWLKSACEIGKLEWGTDFDVSI